MQDSSLAIASPNTSKLDHNTDSSVAVSLSHVSKCFKRYTRPVERLKEVLLAKRNYADTFWALRDVNLEIFRGETLGILGRNGSGKSTLLQIIASTLTPTTGGVRVSGRVSALLELGSGFNPEFTGRQNVFFNGRILGLTQAEIEQKFDEIVEFADIGDFIDRPVKNYSSGMFVRLAFAVAIHVNPDVLIVDEALAVGDIFFQQKCYKRLKDLRDQGVSIIFVTHDTQAIVSLCDRAIVLQDGQIQHIGNPGDMVAKYIELHYSQFSSSEEQQAAIESVISDDVGKLKPLNDKVQTPHISGLISADLVNHRYGCAQGLIAGVSAVGESGLPQSVFKVGEKIILSIQINQHATSICPLNIGFQIKDRLGQMVIGTNTCFLKTTINSKLFGQPFTCQFEFCLAIAPGQYTIAPAVAEYDMDAQIIYDWIEQASVINVIPLGTTRQDGIYQPEIALKTVFCDEDKHKQY